MPSPERPRRTSAFSRFALHYGMLGVLLLLCLFFSILTVREQQPSGEKAARSVARRIEPRARDLAVLIVVRPDQEDARFASALERDLASSGRRVAAVVRGDPVEVRRGLEGLLPLYGPEALLIATPAAYAPTVRSVMAQIRPGLRAEIVLPRSYRWPTFLLADNLLNVANQIAVIAILAVGMTMVILTGGIDLSVGSLIALAAVVVAGLIRSMGGEAASAGAMFAGGAAAVLLCGAIGAFSGLMVTRFRVPPFIATLGMMQVASGIAYILSRGRPIYQVPEGFVALGRGGEPFLGIPYAVLLMAGLYAVAHLILSRTVPGRYIYAIGGNAEAARLAGVPVRPVLVFVYVACGALAGLGGVVMASQLKSGAPTYGLMYELYVIAAVVVGGTSLNGGEGKILGTLIGAFIIAVIQNGMNLTNVESYTQKVVLGLVILGAVLLDQLKHQGWIRGRALGRGMRRQREHEDPGSQGMDQAPEQCGEGSLVPEGGASDTQPSAPAGR